MGRLTFTDLGRQSDHGVVCAFQRISVPMGDSEMRNKIAKNCESTIIARNPSAIAIQVPFVVVLSQLMRFATRTAHHSVMACCLS